MVRAGRAIVEEPDPRSGAVRDPDVEAPVEIPVNHGHRATVIWKVQARSGRDIGKDGSPRVQKRAVALMTAPRGAFVDQVVNGFP